MSTRHFLTLLDFNPDELRALLTRAIELKKILKNGTSHTPLQNKTLAMVFEKASTRTRVSFEVGINQLGGNCVYLGPEEINLGVRESIQCEKVHTIVQNKLQSESPDSFQAYIRTLQLRHALFTEVARCAYRRR